MKKRRIENRNQKTGRWNGFSEWTLNFVVKVLAFCLICYGCQTSPDGTSNEEDDSKENGGGVIDESLGGYTQPRALSGQIKTFSEFDDELSYGLYSSYISIEPNKELRCPLPESDEYKEIVDKLGGFRIPYRIPVEKDATVPKIYSGFEGSSDYLTVMEDSGSGNGLSVDIQRPDRVGRTGDIAFYLSDYYGLVLIDVDSDSPLDSKTRCALSLPGSPRNFLIRNDSVIAIANSLDGYDSGLIHFSFIDGQLEYASSQFFENQHIIDARLFNETLSIYTQVFDNLEDASDDSCQMNRSGSQNRSLSTIASDSCYFFPTVKNHQLSVLDISPKLSLKNTEVFLPDDRADDQTKNRYYSYYNDFLSASGEYLVVTESQTDQIFSHYETKYYSVCTNYREETYNYCTTQWRRVLNPDYVAPSSSGVYNCESDLLTCLKNMGPKVSKYIRVPDGQSCSTYTRNICTSHEYKSYQFPVYTNDSYTRFNVFRFEDNNFVKLDDTLAKVTNGNIESTEESFRIKGHLAKHDHIHFNENALYTVTSGDTLNVFSIQGNSAIFVTGLALDYSEYSTVSTHFTDDRIYISESSYVYNDTYQWSSMQTVSIEDPVSPIIDNQISIPTRLDQLVFDDDRLIGIGSTTLNLDQGRFAFGTITQFTSLGSEVDSLVLGTDYKYYSHSIYYDDQVLNLDRSLNRIFLPYSAYGPFDPLNPVNTHRLTVASLSNDTLTEEHTFAFLERPDRSLSIADNLAFSFSDSYINILHKDDEWSSQEIFNGEIPDSLYQSRSFSYLVKKYDRSNQYKFVLIDSDSLSATDSIDSLVIEKARTHFCTQEQVYFDNDRILIVSEASGVYFDYDDCAHDGSDLKTLVGYRISESGFETIDDQQELQTLFSQTEKDLRCVVDVDNWEGEEISDPVEVPEDAVCYSAERYYEILWERWTERESSLLQLKGR
ncbi:MAG: hypothetical protein GY866_27675 [Proteobacteria bacterium]|nr:hypothetical protein [Pseudomonadota bacterium]